MPEPSSPPDRDGAPALSAPRPLARLAIEFGPLLLFFLANWRFGIFAATAAFMAAILLSLAASWRIERRLPPVALVTAVFVLVFGSLTIGLRDERFIQLKPTIVNALFAAILAGGLLANRLYLQIVFGTAFCLTEEGWRRLTWRWIVFFLVLAGLNELVRRNASTDAWVAFKTFGILPLTILYTLTLVPLLRRFARR
ncbi:MAG: septation protein A [Planctomycetota bacterium]